MDSIKDIFMMLEILPDLKLRSTSPKNFNETSGKEAIKRNIQEALSYRHI